MRKKKCFHYTVATQFHNDTSEKLYFRGLSRCRRFHCQHIYRSNVNSTNEKRAKKYVFKNHFLGVTHKIHWRSLLQLFFSYINLFDVILMIVSSSINVVEVKRNRYIQAEYQRNTGKTLLIPATCHSLASFISAAVALIHSWPSPPH